MKKLLNQLINSCYHILMLMVFFYILSRLMAAIFPSTQPLHFWAEAKAQKISTLKKIAEQRELVIGYREASIPFSYLDEHQKPIGYSIEICQKVARAIQTKLGLDDLNIILQPISSSNRFSFLREGAIDLECGSTVNTQDRQKQVSFSVSIFQNRVRTLVWAHEKIRDLSDLSGKAIASLQGTSFFRLLREQQKIQGLELQEIPAKDPDDAFGLLEKKFASAVVLDEVLLSLLRSGASTPERFVFLPEVLRIEPYALVMRKNDRDFKQLVDKILIDLMKSGEMEQIYQRWFNAAIPPKNQSLNLPISAELKSLFQQPNDLGIER